MAKKTKTEVKFNYGESIRRLRQTGPQRLYLIWGPEDYLAEQYLAELRRLCVGDEADDFSYRKLNERDFSAISLAEAIDSVPFLSERSMVEVRGVDLNKLSETDEVIKAISDIPDYCTVVFTYTAASWKPDKRMKKLWEAIDHHGLIVEFPKQDQNHLIAWITRHFAARDKRISPELCAYLIEITDGTMTSLMGEIDKIAAFSGADAICKADIDAVTEPVLDAVVFQMTDLMSAGRYDEALLKLRQLLKMQQEPIQLLGAIGAHFRRLGTARTLLDNGRNSAELQKLCGLPDYPARKTMEAARRFSASFCKKAACLILETDYKLKTSYDDSRRLLELLILDLSREAANG